MFGTFYNQPGLEYEKFRQAKAFAYDFSLNIDRQLEFHSHASRGIDGHIYIHQPVGASIWLAPLVLIFKVFKADKWSYFLTKAFGVFGLEAFALTLLVRWFSFYFSLDEVFCAFIIFLFGSDWFGNWKMLGSDGISLSWGIIGICALLRFDLFPSILKRETMKYILGFLGGLFLFWARYQYLLIGIPLITYGLFHYRKQSLIFGSGMATAVLIQLFINKMTMGDFSTFAVQRSCFNSCLDPNPSGYIEPSSIWYWPIQLKKIYNDLWSEKTGIFRYSPLLSLIAFIFSKFIFRKNFNILIGTGLLMLFFTFLSNTYGAGGWGNRFAQSLHILWGIPLIYFLLSLKKRTLIFSFLIFLVNPFAFFGSFFYVGDEFSGQFFESKNVVTLISDFLKWSHVEISSLTLYLIWLATFICWLLMLFKVGKDTKKYA